MNIEGVEYFVIAIVSYIFGIVTGLYLRNKFIDENKVLKQNTFVLIIVSVIWALSMFFDIFNPEYTTSPMVHGLMGAIVGFFYKPLKGEK